MTKKYHNHTPQFNPQAPRKNHRTLPVTLHQYDNKVKRPAQEIRKLYKGHLIMHKKTSSKHRTSTNKWNNNKQ